MELLGAILAPLVLVGLLYLLVEYGIPSLILKLANYDAGWSPYRMRTQPGMVTMMVKGKETGPFDRVLPADIPEWHYHEGNERFYKEGTDEFNQAFPNGAKKAEGYLAKIGVVKVGFFKRYYRRDRKYDVYDPASTSETHINHKEIKGPESRLFYFATTMVVNMETVPSKDNYPVNLKVVFNVLFIFPRRAEFLAGKWEVQAVASVRTRAREYIASKTIAQLRDERDIDKDDFVDHILLANKKQSGESGTVGLLAEYGVEIQGPYYVDLDLESGDKEMTEAMRRQMIAKEDVETAKIKKKETVINAKAKRDARKLEAEGIREEVTAWGSNPVGGQVALKEAIENNVTATTLVVGINPNIAIPVEK